MGGKYFNQAVIYRIKSIADDYAYYLKIYDEDCEVKTIHIIED